MFDMGKHWKDIERNIEYGSIELVGLVVFGIILILSFIVEMPPYAISLVSLIAMFIFAVTWIPKQAEKRKSNEAIKTINNRLKDFDKKFLNRGESNSFFSLSKNPPTKEYPDKLWKKYHEWRFKHLELEMGYIKEQITGSILNEQEIRRCFIDLFNATKRCYAFLDEYVSELNEQGNLTEKHKKIVSVYNRFTDVLLEDDRSLDIHVGIQLSQIDYKLP